MGGGASPPHTPPPMILSLSLSPLSSVVDRRIQLRRESSKEERGMERIIGGGVWGGEAPPPFERSKEERDLRRIIEGGVLGGEAPPPKEPEKGRESSEGWFRARPRKRDRSKELSFCTIFGRVRAILYEKNHMFYVLRIMSGKRRAPGTNSDERSRKRDVHNIWQKIPSGDIFLSYF